ncbi:hypothetical protein [Segatella oulorum]|nr:hypothetical protein [Segatella oulorum]
MKRLIKVSMLLMMATLLAACNNEEITQQDKEKKIDAPKGGVVFATNDTKISAKRWFIDDKAFTDAKTRTDIKHIPGNGADVYWTSDDFIWVKKQDGTWAKSTAITLHDGGASAEFTLPGSKSDYTDGCEVRYTGTSRTKFGAFNVPGGVGIHAYQNRTTPNDFSNAGEWGDCGSGKAYNTGNPAKFNFTLAHKASYLCFLPRCENTTLAPNIRLKGIKITATNEMRFADLCMFDGEELTAPGSPFGWDFINVDLPDFKIDTKANQALNAVYMVVRPGTYNFKIEYTIEDPTTHVVGTITDVRTGITLNKDNFYDVTANLVPKNYNFEYYMWDADHPYLENISMPDVYDNGYSPTGIAMAPGDNRWYNYTAGTLAQAGGTAQFCPNINEALWYVDRGDPHWDNSIWSSHGHLYSGGMWILRKNYITGFSSEHDPNGVDWRTKYTNANRTNTSVTPQAPTASEQYKYFYLPANGRYEDGKLEHVGGIAYYWTSTTYHTIIPGLSPASYSFGFWSGDIGVNFYTRDHGFCIVRAE